MIHYYSNFYKGIYQKSGGYIPLWPFMSSAELGDLVFLQYGQMVKIGNIFDPFFGIKEKIIIEEAWQPLLESWDIQSGVHQSFQSKVGMEEFSNIDREPGLMLQFDSSGDYIFSSSEIYERSIENFYSFKFNLLQQLASEKFSFTEIFVVTSIAKTELFSLLIAATDAAYALISTEENKPPYYTLADLNRAEFQPRISEMQSIIASYLKQEGGSLFFKAQKLESSPQGKEKIKTYIKENLPESMQKNSNNILKYVSSQLLPTTELFPSNVHDFFHFREMNFDDVSAFFGKY